MRSTVIWSFLSLVLAAGGLAVGCDSDAKIAKSAIGESCDGTADCNEPLKCIDHVCSKAGGGGSDSAGGAGDPGAAGADVGPTGPVLSTEGESCTKRADCEEGLACFNQRCVMDATGEGGGGNLPEVRVGQLGETCGVSADCAPDLACLPGGQLTPLPYGAVGVCSRPSGAYTPTGMNCAAECLEAADCCELPVELHALYTVGTPYGAGAESCADLAVQLEAVNCGGVLTAANAAKCFAQATYCNCTAKTWTCDAGVCNYGPKCTDDGATPGGCPAYSRSSKPLYTLCSTDGLCAPEAIDPTCARDADCNGEVMADLGLLCEDGECTCYKASGLCYRKCDGPLDCKPGQTCEDATHVCVPEPGCSSDAQCAITMLNPRARCVAEACMLGCTSDYECNGGSISSVTSLVCAPDHVCREIGCSDNTQCSNAGINVTTPVKMFCTAPEPLEAGTIVNSAITD